MFTLFIIYKNEFTNVLQNKCAYLNPIKLPEPILQSFYAFNMNFK